jgi:hypothetical protein
MAISVIEKIEILASPAEIAKIMFDPNQIIRWVGGIREVREISNEPLGTGSKHSRIADYAGKDVEYALEVTDFIPDKLLVMDTKKSPFPMEVAYKIEVYQQNHSIVEIKLEGNSEGFLMFLDRLSTIMVSQHLKGDLQRLKDMAEGVSWLDK